MPAERTVFSITLRTDRIKPSEVPIDLSSNTGNYFWWASRLGGEKRESDMDLDQDWESGAEK